MKKCLACLRLGRLCNAHKDIEKLRVIISSDAYAISFQSLRQYREALLKEIGKMYEKKGKK